MRVIIVDDKGEVTSATIETNKPTSGLEKPRHLEFEYSRNILRNSWATLAAARRIVEEGGNRVMLSYRSSLLAEHALKPGRKEIIEKILEYNLGHRCVIRTVYEPDDQRIW